MMKDIMNMNNTALTMSSVEIAELTEKLHRNVTRTVKDLIAKELINPAQVEQRYNNGKNTRTIYNLNKRDSLVLVARLSPEFTAAIVDRWQELELEKANQTFDIPDNLPDALRLAADLAEENGELKLENTKQANSIEVKDQLIIASNDASIKAGDILVREFVKSCDTIDIGEKKMFKWLRDQGFIGANNEPYQRYVKQGLFVWKPSKVEYNGKTRYQLLITARGKVILAAKYLQFIDRIDFLD